MITDSQVKKLKRLIKDYNEASIEQSWAGSYDLDDRMTIEENLKITRRRLNDFIRELKNEC